MKESCVITTPDQKQCYDFAIARLAQMGVESVWKKAELCSTKDPQTVIAHCRGYQYVIAGGEIWNQTVFDACPTLRLIVRFGAGYDAIDLAAASRAGVAVCYMPGHNAQAVAEQTVGLMLATLRRIPYMDQRMHAGDKRAANFTVPQLTGKTVGILGCGNIGKRVAHIVSGFGCRILAFDSVRDDAFAATHSAEYVDLPTLLSGSDVVTVHLPMNADTRWIINRHTLGMMKPSAILVNTSRGGTVCTADLADALESGGLYGAGLDVFEEEGNASHSLTRRLCGLDNVVMTPHVSGATFETYHEMMRHAVDVIAAFREGQPPADLLNPDYVLSCKAASAEKQA